MELSGKFRRMLTFALLGVKGSVYLEKGGYSQCS